MAVMDIDAAETLPLGSLGLLKSTSKGLKSTRLFESVNYWSPPIEREYSWRVVLLK